VKTKNKIQNRFVFIAGKEVFERRRNKSVQIGANAKAKRTI
jgi:hypothetical protein